MHVNNDRLGHFVDGLSGRFSFRGSTTLPAFHIFWKLADIKRKSKNRP